MATSVIPSSFGVHAVAEYHRFSLLASCLHASQMRRCKFSSDSSSSSSSSSSVGSRANGFGGNTDTAAASFTSEFGMVSIEWASSKVRHPVYKPILRKGDALYDFGRKCKDCQFAKMNSNRS